MFDLSDVGEVIAERRLYVEAEPDKKVRVLLGKPVRRPTPFNDEFSLCPYQIVGLGNETIRAAGGVDSIQAIQLAMEMIGADLHLRYGPEFKLHWEAGKGGDLGFPLPGDPEDQG